MRLVSELAVREWVSLSVEMDGDDERLVADERLVKQMLLNLLSNAVRFTPAGGNIAVLVNLDDNGELLMSVIDNGVGIAE
ncbi:MAG: ATP-binding protein, partial [Alphaproteobacteria bacterium]|nr:ATP-binding protein [Alphaproteobacteria bacterium]